MKYQKWQEGNKNFYFGDSYIQAMSQLNILLTNYENTPLNHGNVGLSYEEFQNFNKELMKQGLFEWFIAGNFEKDKALRIVDNVE